MKSMTSEARAALAAKMKVVINDPEMRRRVSDATKKAMRDIAERTPDLRLLLDVWTQAPPWAREQFLCQNIRKRFLKELLSPLFVDRVCETKSAPEGPAR
jgi:hypothetical protein